MDPKQIVLLAFQVSIAATVFGFGLGATREDLLYLWRRPVLLGRSLVSVLVVMPVVALVLAQVFDFRPLVEIALIALSISPIPPLLPGRMASMRSRLLASAWRFRPLSSMDSEASDWLTSSWRSRAMRLRSFSCIVITRRASCPSRS